MDFFRACLKKIGAFPFSNATGPELVHEKMFSWSPEIETFIGLYKRCFFSTGSSTSHPGVYISLIVTYIKPYTSSKSIYILLVLSCI